MEILLTALRAAFYGTAFVAFWTWLALAARRWDDQLGGELSAWTTWPGVLLLTAGVPLMVTCAGVFVVRGHGTAAPFDPPREFVAVGPYRRVRNPMYDGAFLALTGLGLVLHSPAMLLFVLVPVVCAILLVHLYEEPDLDRRFGESYRTYRRTVPRWLPRLRRGR